MAKTDKEIIELLGKSGPLTLKEIAKKLDKKPKIVFRALRKLFQKGQITSNPTTHQYLLTQE